MVCYYEGQLHTMHTVTDVCTRTRVYQYPTLAQHATYIFAFYLEALAGSTFHYKFCHGEQGTFSHILVNGPELQNLGGIV